ncbi:hypothetical protein [Pedobacter yulinensis]|nr:hypothetical protein [Pedobacter yulinensis]
MENQENEQAVPSSGDERNLDDASMAMDGPLRSGEQQQGADNLDETDPGASASAGGYGNDLDTDAAHEDEEAGDESFDTDPSEDEELGTDEELGAGEELDTDEESAGDLTEDDDEAIGDDLSGGGDEELPDGNGLTPRPGADEGRAF